MSIQANNQKIYETLQDIVRLADDCSQLLKGVNPARTLNTPPRKEIIKAFLHEMNIEVHNVYELLREEEEDELARKEEEEEEYKRNVLSSLSTNHYEITD